LTQRWIAKRFDEDRFGDRKGFPTYRVGRVVTEEDVRSLDDDECGTSWRGVTTDTAGWGGVPIMG
jgi:hypothetical protein